MHNRSMFRKYVRHVDIGTEPVNEVWIGNTQLYPDNETLVKELHLDLSKVQWNYFVHALRGVTYGHELYSAKAQMLLKIGDEKWWVGDNRPTTLYRARLTEDGVLSFGTDEGPAASDLAVGRLITLEATIPETEDMQFSIAEENAKGTKLWENPWLPNTDLRMSWNKGRKKESAGVRYKLTSHPSGKHMIAGAGQKNGHKRGLCGYGGMGNGDSSVFPCRVCDYSNGESSDNVYRKGDISLHGTFEEYNAAGNLTARPVYPAFHLFFDMKIKNIVLQGRG